MIDDTTVTRDELIKQHIDSFPVLPVTVTRLIKVTSDPESSARDVMDVILPDQSLCLTILKIANSALFGRPKKVDSIAMAVSLLGFNEVQRIALTKALINSFSKLSREHKRVIDKHWIHSFSCGMIARIIAKDLYISPDIAFMGGLIHDIGKLVMLETFLDDYTAEYWLTRFSDEEMLREELRIFSFTHDLIGGQLLRKWDFPENLVTAVSHHHSPTEAGEEKGLAHVIQLADLLSFACCNQDALGDEEILSVVRRSLPDLFSDWLDLGLAADDDSIGRWFEWLVSNYEEGANLKEAFSF
jgi:putative nucleotidyltransferase with HDIG domain